MADHRVCSRLRFRRTVLVGTGARHHRNVAACCAGLTVVLALAQSGHADEPPLTPKSGARVDRRVDRLGDPLPPGALLRLGTLRFQHPGVVQDMALSPDGKTLVTIGGPLVVWDTATGKARWEAGAQEIGYETNGPRYGDCAPAFAPHGRWFYLPSRNQGIRQWEAVTGRPRTVSLHSASRGYRSIAVSPDGRKLALGSAQGVLVCDQQGATLYEIENHPQGPATKDRDDRLAFYGHYSSGVFSPDRKTLAVVTSDDPKVIRLVDSETGRELRRVGLTDRLVRLAFSPDGKRIAATERDNAVRLYSTETGQPVWSHIVKLDNIYENYTSGVAFSPDGKIVALGATDHRIYFCDAATGTEIARLVGHHEYPWCLAFAPDGKTLYSAGWDGTIRVWDVAARKQLPPPTGLHGSSVVAASPDGQTLAFADDVNIVHVVSAKDGSECRTFDVPDIEYSQLMFAPDGQRLAAGAAGGREVRTFVWDVKTGELVRRFHWPIGRDPHSTVDAFSFTPDGKLLAAAVFRQSAAYMFDLVNGMRIARIKHGQVYGLSFSPDGHTLATGGWDSTIRLVDTGTWKTRQEVKVPGQGSGIYGVCYAREGDWLATGHMDNRVRVWNAADMKLRKEVEGVGFVFPALAASPDGLWLATGGSGGEITLWDPETGQKVWSVGKHRSHAYTVGFGRDSRTLVSGGDDGMSYLWDLQPTGDPRAIEHSALWESLIGTDSAVAYQAMWALLGEPKFAVDVISERTPQLVELLDQKATTVPVALRRVLSLLAQIRTPEAIQLLTDWSKRDASGPLGAAASNALKRLHPIVKTGS